MKMADNYVTISTSVNADLTMRGVINCDNFFCPSSTYKCVIDRITDESNTITTKYCLDSSGRVVDKEDEKIPNLTSERNYRHGHAEADITGRLVVNNQGHGSQNSNFILSSSSTGNRISAEDLAKIKEMQDNIKESTAQLRNSIQSQVQEMLKRIQGMQFPFAK